MRRKLTDLAIVFLCSALLVGALSFFNDVPLANAVIYLLPLYAVLFVMWMFKRLAKRFGSTN